MVRTSCLPLFYAESIHAFAGTTKHEWDWSCWQSDTLHVHSHTKYTIDMLELPLPHFTFLSCVLIARVI